MRRPHGDPEARFAQLFADTRRDLLAYALRRTRTAEDAADVVAETYLIAWRKLDSLPEGDEARLWLFGVARNVVLRGATRERALEDVVDRLAGELREVTVAADPAGDERTATLRTAVMSLPGQQREVLLLTAWEGLTPQEIATVTGAPVNLVRVRLHRARSRLKRELSQPRPRRRSSAAFTSGQSSSITAYQAESRRSPPRTSMCLRNTPSN